MATLVVVGLGALLVPAASAQVGYPAGPCTPANRVFDVGTHPIGSTFSVRLITFCLWDVGNQMALTVNDESLGTRTVDSGGGVTIDVTVVSATQLSISGSGPVRGGCGENKAFGVSTSSAAGGAQESATATFRVPCPTATVHGGVAFTGSNVARWGGIAVALIAGGWMVVAFARRRRANTST